MVTGSTGAGPAKPSTLTDLLAASYVSPPRECDIIMKGGVTSGVVYPLAVCELAPMYRFRSIGGTSAGAIAAALTAAAEYRRRCGEAGLTDRAGLGAGFRMLADLPARLGRNGFLFSLFQPQPATARLFRIVTAWSGPRQGRGRRVAAAVLANIPESAAALVGLAGVVPAVLVWPSSWPLGVLLLVLGLALALAGAVGGLVIGFARRAIRALPENGYGLCSGAPGVTDRESPALTPWLTRFINEVAGKPMSAGPLTFGELWDAGRPTAERTPGGDAIPDDPVINLEMLTTNVTFGRPYRLPFRERVFFYDPDEWAALFPAEVIRWMNEHPRQPQRAEDQVSLTDSRLRPLPDARDLPVVVATRLSLSFPFLLSAVPLYAIDYTRANRQDRLPERCWFSDGGLTSNFPVHFFDAPLPRRPTFGINLSLYHPDHPHEDVWMPYTTGEGVNESWTRFDHVPPGKEADPQWPEPTNRQKLVGFALALLAAAKDWRDNLQLHVPGYRERVVHVHLTEDEGGYNLDMPEPTLRALSERGRQAGALLWSRYAEPLAPAAGPNGGAPVSWECHRWTRFRSTMSVLQGMLRQMATAFAAKPANGDRSYAELIAPKPGRPPVPCYPFHGQGSPESLLDATEQLVGLPAEWEEHGVDFGKASRPPRPFPELRIVPRI